MSCAQVMYQPYAPSPYVVQTDAPQAVPPHAPGPATTPGGDSRHSEGVLHMSQPPAASVTPQTPPHAHHHHHHQQQHQPQPLPQPQGGEGSSGQVQQQGAGDPSGGQRALPRPPYRAASTGSAAADVDAPPPEKKFCSEAEAPAGPPTPTHQAHHQHHQHPPHHHQHHQHHHHHHHHHQHHHPPLTDPPGSPSEQANEVKYVSANCMVVTHYAGDAAAVVDEHFTRALSTPHFDKPHSPGKGRLVFVPARLREVASQTASSPMSSRNFPPSFWNSNYQVPSSSSSSSSSRPPSLAGHLGASPADLYDPYHGGLHPLQPPAPDHWAAYSLSSQAYGHRSVAHDVYQAAMSSVPSTSRPYHQYSSLSLQPHLARLPGVTAVGTQMGMSKPEAWGARYHEAFTSPDFTHSLDTNYSAPHYPNVPGLETGVPQEGAKDLYWF